MKITLITEGTYPHHLGGVSVWCDQLVREMAEHQFEVLALSATGTETNTWDLPSNVTAVDTLPLWSAPPRRRAGRTLRAQFRPVQERFFNSMAVNDDGHGFVPSLQELAELARGGQLSAAMSSDDAVDTLLRVGPVCSHRPHGAGPGPLSVGDAVDVLVLLEHFLRPLAVPPPTADLCHSVANGLGALPALAAKWAHGTPFLMTEHGLYLRERYLSYRPGSLSQPARSIVLRFFKLLVQAAYKSADLVAPGSGYNRLWELAGGTPPTRICPVRNGIDPSSFPVAISEPAVPTLSWIGRIDPLKDVETLLRAFSLVRAAVPDCRLRIFGPVQKGGEEYLHKCLDLAAELDLDGSATFEGRVGSPVEAYHAGHVVVLTSISEGLPYTVLEAMATGRPVVATDVGGVAEAVGDTGLLVPPRNPSAVADACLHLLANADERRALGKAARSRVVHLFTAKASFDTYRRLYRDVARRPQPQVIDPQPKVIDPQPKVIDPQPKVIELSARALEAELDRSDVSRQGAPA
jgi:glycosyltransferase involved in cell wall biosynthesis